MPQRSKGKGKLNRLGRRRRRNRILLIVIPLLAMVAAVGYLKYQGMLPANQPADVWYEVSKQPKELVKLPADDAPHNNYTEWWYYSGHLRTADGKRFSFHYVIFVINRMAGFTVAHASFLDHQTGKHYSTQLRTAGKPETGNEKTVEFTLGTWKMAIDNGHDRLKVTTPEFSFALQLEQTSPAVLHGGSGLLDFKEAGTSYYYSRPRMRITGTAGPRGHTQAVTGQAWFDHQWGDFRVTALTWNWFAIQLDDDRDLMLFELFTPSGDKVLSFGTLSGNGPAIELGDQDFSIEPLASWTSKNTNITYPMGWRIRIPAHDMVLRLEPVARDAEFDGRLSSYLVYWEGPVDISGTQAGQGFVELSHGRSQSSPDTL